MPQPADQPGVTEEKGTSGPSWPPQTNKKNRERFRPMRSMPRKPTSPPVKSWFSYEKDLSVKRLVDPEGGLGSTPKHASPKADSTLEKEDRFPLNPTYTQGSPRDKKG